VFFADASGSSDRKRGAHGTSNQINGSFGESTGMRDKKKSNH
jgi:hypothetical protein